MFCGRGSPCPSVCLHRLLGFNPSSWASVLIELFNTEVKGRVVVAQPYLCPLLAVFIH